MIVRSSGNPWERVVSWTLDRARLKYSRIDRARSRQAFVKSVRTVNLVDITSCSRESASHEPRTIRQPAPDQCCVMFGSRHELSTGQLSNDSCANCDLCTRPPILPDLHYFCLSRSSLPGRKVRVEPRPSLTQDQAPRRMKNAGVVVVPRSTCINRLTIDLLNHADSTRPMIRP